jgi:hypothetical protein
MSGTYRHGRVYCQSPGCRRPVSRAVEIDLPAAWEPDAQFTTLTVTVGLCRDHGHEAARRARALLEARSELPTLLHIIDGAVLAERDLMAQLGSARRRATRAEYERGVLQRAHLRLLQASGSEVADVRGVRMGLGLPA